MAAPRKQQVCLRGASAREITRDALLERVSQERELRNYNRKTVNAALFIQRIWRSYHVKSKFMGDLQHEWETKVSKENLVMNSTWISTSVLRPFLFFVSCTPTTHQKVAETKYGCMLTCFDILLHSINSTDPEGNYCALALGTAGEKRIWLYQTQKLVSVCFRTLVECNTIGSNVDSLKLISLAMRLVVSLTDSKNWKSLNSVKLVDSELPINDLVRYMATGKSNLYGCIRKYIMKYEALTISMKKDNVKIADHFLIVASVMTLALRPFHVMKDANENFFSEVKEAAENFSTYVLTIPWLTKCIPSILLPALKHESVLRHCLNAIVVADEKIFTEMSRLDKQETNDDRIPSIGWALANIINLATEDHKRCGDSERFVDGLDCTLYICAMNKIAEKLVKWIENLSIPCEKLNQGRSFGSGNVCFMDLLMPVQKQWHLMFLLNWSKNYLSEVPCISSSNHVYIFHKLRFQDIAFFYSCMLRAFSSLNPLNGSLPILNTLSFTPGFLVELWNVLEGFLWYESNQSGKNNVKYCNVRINDDANSENGQTQVTKDTSNKWINVLQKITGKSLMIANHEHSSEEASEVFKLDEEEDPNPFYIETLRKGSQCLSKDMSSLLHLFYAAYSHLLIVLDDIEFYQRQVPFVLDQQCKIASVVNTLVYNSLVYNNGQNTPLIDAAIRCLRLLYERDCRHKFCPPSLWTAPSRGCRTPQATVVRVNEASSSSLRPGDTSLITTTPHVFPFEERVKMFREFIRLDKVSQRMIGEIAGPGPGSIEIVIRRNHIVEDGFQQLNFLGSRLKLGIHVSFVSECGLLEAGLDYGGLSKEFLTDISSAVFSPEYGLFSQTSTSERYLIPSASARLIDNGFQMIEFLGRVVGKALYEGILLDYSFSLVFIQKLLGCYSFIDELSTLDPELYKNVMYVKHYDGDVRELCLDFTITEEVLGNRIVTELKPGGKNVTVTNDNKLQYVHAIADYKLNRQVLPMANAFYRGLTDLISPSWLSLFNANEFNQLLSGGNHDFDVEDLRSNTLYTGGYSEGNRTIKLFWEVVAGFEPKERCKLLKFVTSCSRAPLLGFKHLQPAFTIHKVPCDVPLWAAIGGQDVDRLPSASTCYNTLKLPTYKRASTLKTKLLYAISSNAGFELS